MMLLLAALAWAQEPAAEPLPDKITVSVARLPLPAGKKLTWDDLTTVDLPRQLVPPTAITKGTELVGRTLAHPVAQQSAIVGQRLEGWVPPPAPPVEEEVEATVQVAWDLGPMGALIQAGDVVVWTKLGEGCRLAQGEVLSRGAKTVFEVRAVEAEALKAARDPSVLLRGPGATTTGLSPCTDEPQVLIEGVP